ncbi:hypothetical protein BCR34DRAFT_560924 [Clohesyomyces aquaticus]|uniref:Uncharacterized protein n=1 Tax=Clohesyomyces aquaticus TaxID=1231657 RepID=A0A1Y1ZVB7_9PLEO|nr:hypothetical protein BCR34DRAFT_560924 [Clohesyomyces aquaticus]
MPVIRPPPPSHASSSPSLPTSTSTSKIPPFAQCKYTAYTANVPNWYQITTPHHFPDFDICADCYNASLAPTPYSRFISPLPQKPEGVSTRCDFSDLWIRVAWAWIFMQKQEDLGLLGRVAGLTNDEGACPNLDPSSFETPEDEDFDFLAEIDGTGVGDARQPATRIWYCLRDPATGAELQDWTVCSDCVQHLLTIASPLQDINTQLFHPVSNGQKILATCDLKVPKEEDRTIAYIDQFIQLAESLLPASSPSPTSTAQAVSSLTSYIRRWASIPACPKSRTMGGRPRYVPFPQDIPEFTVCQECYDLHLEPLLQTQLQSSSTKPNFLAKMQKLQLPTTLFAGLTCNLSSPRLHAEFTALLNEYSEPKPSSSSPASAIADFRTLLQTRNVRLQEFRQKGSVLKTQYAQHRQAVQFHYEMMQIGIASENAQHTLQAFETLGREVVWRTENTDPTPPDSSTHMSQGLAAESQANAVLANLRLLRKEWVENWE